MLVGMSAKVFFSGMPSEAAGPVADKLTPTVMSARTIVAAHRAADAASSDSFFIRDSSFMAIFIWEDLSGCLVPAAWPSMALACQADTLSALRARAECSKLNPASQDAVPSVC